MKPLRLIAMAASLFLAACHVPGFATVGIDVQKGDITDFYYTYSSSANPPEYLRFRFFVEEGKRYFFCEKREGKHWPLTENDTVFSTTMEIDEEDWDSFYACLENGRVAQRQESVEAGGSGPWLYLYWKKDRDVLQEFSFADKDKEDAFLLLCDQLAAKAKD